MTTKKLLTMYLSNVLIVRLLGHSVLTLSGGTLRPSPAAACVPKDMVPATSAPANAPEIAPLGPTHQQTMPKVKMPHEVLAAMADSAVATPTEMKGKICIRRFIGQLPQKCSS